MHSSRMRTARSSSRYRGGLHNPLEQRSPFWSRYPPGCGPGDTPETRSSSTSPLVVGLETPQPDPPQLPPLVWAWKPARHAGIPPPWRPAARYAGIPPALHAGIAGGTHPTGMHSCLHTNCSILDISLSYFLAEFQY